MRTPKKVPQPKPVRGNFSWSYPLFVEFPFDDNQIPRRPPPMQIRLGSDYRSFPRLLRLFSSSASGSTGASSSRRPGPSGLPLTPASFSRSGRSRSASLPRPGLSRSASFSRSGLSPPPKSRSGRLLAPASFSRSGLSPSAPLPRSGRSPPPNSCSGRSLAPALFSRSGGGLPSASSSRPGRSSPPNPRSGLSPPPNSSGRSGRSAPPKLPPRSTLSSPPKLRPPPGRSPPPTSAWRSGRSMARPNSARPAGLRVHLAGRNYGFPWCKIRE